MRSKTPFEMSRKQKKNIADVKAGIKFFTPINSTKAHTGDIWKAHRRKGQHNILIPFGRPINVNSYFEKKVLTT